ncbi:MAG: family 65 glycosyl hydrolase domain-containing protein [Flavobacteriaceae bacterium]
MRQDYIVAHPWKIIEEGFDPQRVESSESLFSIGNGAMGQRANFEENYSGKTFQGSYIGGVYYPDKTRVGWWKNGYPEYFAKVLNAPNWIGIRFWVDGEEFDIATHQIQNFRRELDMQNGVYTRSFSLSTSSAGLLEVVITRFLSMARTEIGAIKFQVKAMSDCRLEWMPYIDGGVQNQDSNWDDPFWKHTQEYSDDTFACLRSHTLKTDFQVATYMDSQLLVDEKTIPAAEACTVANAKISSRYVADLKKGQTAQFYKFGGYVSGTNHAPEELLAVAKQNTLAALKDGFDQLLEEQKQAWSDIWKSADITIDGDVKAQQAIRFNIFQLNQTYNGHDSRLNIGPKGFTGEKYGGSTYWDTEAYCLPFYMATKDKQVARNLLKYRFNQLPQAIENAQKLGFTDGAALYPMVTMNGEECHNEWEITFEEIHRNGAIAFAIYNYIRYTDDTAYMAEMGLEVLIGIARFWAQRFHFSTDKDAYVMLGVTGPNEYENNINNNWYTNYIAKWCLQYTAAQFRQLMEEAPKDGARIQEKTAMRLEEAQAWETLADQVYFPRDEKRQIFLQQDGFLDKDLKTVDQLNPAERPINQYWSWDRILRSPYIKQADTLQGFYLFEDHFTAEELERHYNFYEPFTVHESSLSPCVHSILAAKLDKMDDAYALYLRTARLDLDDYNKEVEEGLHITSMAGTWMSVVEGFGGLRVRSNQLHLSPKLPQEWDGFGFKINFREGIVELKQTTGGTHLCWTGPTPLEVQLHGNPVCLTSDKETFVQNT